MFLENWGEFICFGSEFKENINLHKKFTVSVHTMEEAYCHTNTDLVVFNCPSYSEETFKRLACLVKILHPYFLVTNAISKNHIDENFNLFVYRYNYVPIEYKELLLFCLYPPTIEIKEEYSLFKNLENLRDNILQTLNDSLQ